MEKGGVFQNLTTIKKVLPLISAVFEMQLFHALSLDREKTKAEIMYSLIWSIYFFPWYILFWFNDLKWKAELEHLVSNPI